MEAVVCPVCSGKGRLLDEVCPMCDGDYAKFLRHGESTGPADAALDVVAADEAMDEDAEEEEEEEEDDDDLEPIVLDRPLVFEINLGRNQWVRYDRETEMLINLTAAAGKSEARYAARGQSYVIDLKTMSQINARTGVAREIRCREAKDDELDIDEEDEEILAETPLPPRSDRFNTLVNGLLSSTIQVPLPPEAPEEEATLTSAEVESIVRRHVPGVDKFLFRDSPGQYALRFLVGGYFTGIRAFAGTPVQNHLLWLLRFIIHYAHADKPDASCALRQVAEGFMECQAVQARTIERVGMELLGVRADFSGLVTRLAGEYKGMALKMLARDRISRRLVMDDPEPTHYENRLTADLGPLLGLNRDDVRRAELDTHAAQRFPPLHGDEAKQAAGRCRAFLDVEAFLQTLVNEINSLNEETPQESLPRQFVDWANTWLVDPHIVFDDSALKLEVDLSFILAVVEFLVLGKQASSTDEKFHGHAISELFLSSPRQRKDEAASSATEKSSEGNATSSQKTSREGGGSSPKERKKAKSRHRSK